jgi:HemY protein
VIKLLWRIGKFGAIIALAVWLADHPGHVRIVWQGYSVETSAALLVFAVVVLIALCLAAYRFWRVLRYGTRGIKTRRALNRQSLGLLRLEQTLTALAAGDLDAAHKRRGAAEKLLGKAPLTEWLRAQSAQLAGDHVNAARLFTELSKTKAYEVVSMRALINIALKQNKPARAAALTQELEAKHPKLPWLQVARYEIAVRQGDWGQAATALRQASQRQQLDLPDGKERQAGLLIAEARQALERQRHPHALQVAEAALQAAPDFLPARIELVKILLAAGYVKQAQKRIDKFWRTTPHPELGELYLSSLDAETSPLTRYKQVEHLCRHAPKHPASLILWAKAALQAELWGEAERQLQIAVGLTPTRRVYALLAEIAERDNKPETDQRDYLQRAAKAVMEPHWLCQSCGHQPALWEIQCPSCAQMQTIFWYDPFAEPVVLDQTTTKSLQGLS